MTIKFSCPKCQKPFVVADDKAGKRAKCVGCQSVISVPAPVAPPANIEEFAAAALADQPAPVAVAPTFIEFECYFCAEKVKVAAELEGKQTSCPECRKIIKVPLQQKQALKDWRKADPRIPSGAKQNMEPPPEGTWSTRSAAMVSKEALLSADAVPIVRRRLTWGQRFRRMGIAAAGLVVIGLITLSVRSFLHSFREDRALHAALDAVAKIPVPLGAELLRGAGDYYARGGQKAKEANDQFSRARALLAQTGGQGPEGEWVLIDLAISQVELGGDKAQSLENTRLEWETIGKELRRTLEHISTPEARVEAVARVGRALLTHNQEKLAQAAATWYPESAADLNAVLGLEFLQLGDKTKAQAQAEIAQKLYVVPAERAATTNPPRNLILLWLALGDLEKAIAVSRPPEPGKPCPPSVLLGWIEGKARGSQAADARIYLRDIKTADLRLAALVALATGHAENDPTAAREDIKEAIQVFETEKNTKFSPWDLYHLVVLMTKLEPARALEIAAKIPDATFRSRAQLAILRENLTKLQEPAGRALFATVEGKTAARGIAVMSLVERNMRMAPGSATNSEMDALEPEIKPFFQLGQALGLQAGGR